MSKIPRIPFVGDDRNAIVDEFLNAFSRIQKSCQPELHLLVAPAGWGKTRIIQEFYRQLAAKQNKDSRYWPADFFGVMRTVLDLDIEAISEQRRRVRHVSDFRVPQGAVIPWLWLAPSVRSVRGTGSALVIDDLYLELRAHMGPLLDRASAVHESLGSVAQLAGALLPLPDIISVITEGSSALQCLSALIKSLRETQIHPARTVDRLTGTEQRADEVGRLIRQIAIGGLGHQPLPIILILDDAHGLDRVATDLVTSLVGCELPILIIATTWPDQYEAEGPFCSFVRSSSSERVFVRRLQPLAGGDLANVVNAFAPQTEPDVIRALVSRAGPNPYALMLLLSCEAVRISLINQAINLNPSEVSALGSSIEKLLDEHWEPLPIESRLLIGAAALIGETFPRRPLAKAIEELMPEETLEKYAHPLWIRRLPESAELFAFLERVRYELALSKTGRLFTNERRLEILQDAADAIATMVQEADGIDRKVLLALEQDLFRNGADVDPWSIASGAIELATMSSSVNRGDEAIELLTNVANNISLLPDSIKKARVLITCLSKLTYLLQLSNATRKASQVYAERAVALASCWLPDDDSLALLALANKARSLRRESAPKELNEAEEITRDLTCRISTLSECSLEACSSIRRLEVLIEISRGRFSRAAELAATNVAFCEHNFGPLAIETTSAMASLGYSLHRTNLSRAIQVRKDRLERRSERLGDVNHPGLAGTKVDLAISLLDRGRDGDTEQAIILIDQSTKVTSAIFGADSAKCLSARSSMIRARLRQALESESKSDIKLSKSIVDQLDAESVEVFQLRSMSSAIGERAMAYQRRGEVLALCYEPGAIELLRQALAIMRSEMHRDIEHYSIRRCLMSFYWALKRLQRNEAADQLATEYFLSVQEMSGPGF
jgi:hypothetical protein